MQPLLPYARALVARGHEVAVAAPIDVSVVVAGMGADQPHNGRLIARAGAGLALTKPDAGALRAAIRSVLETPSIRAQAQRLAEEIAAMPTIESAVDQLLEMT